jgi:hypothetical protein
LVIAKPDECVARLLVTHSSGLERIVQKLCRIERVERGAARVEAAAALAGADREGAIAQGAAATAAAEPDAGALAQSAIAVTSASTEDGDDGGGKGRAALSYPSPRGGGGDGGRGGGRRVRGGGGGRGGGGRGGGRDRIASLPATGSGLTPSTPLSSLLAAASAAAALGAFAVRSRQQSDDVASPSVANGNEV